MHAQDHNLSYQIITSEFEEWNDSTGTEKKILFENGKTQFEYYKSETSIIRKAYHENGKLMAYGPVFIELLVDTEFVEDKNGDLMPVPVKGDPFLKHLGQYKEYHDNGKLKFTGTYSKKGKEGTWEEYNRYGDLVRKCNYFENHLYGDYFEYGYDPYEVSEPIVILKGRFAQIHHPYSWGQIKSIKIGKWESYDYASKILGTEEHNWLGKFYKE